MQQPKEIIKSPRLNGTPFWSEGESETETEKNEELKKKKN
jgi:hypothetical protein